MQATQLSSQQSRQPHMLQNQVMVFSKNYLPLARINIKRAIVLLVSGQAESLEFSTQQWEVCSPSVILQVPQHIRLTTGNPERYWKTPAVNRREVFRRDHHTCQYCGSTKQLTLDHVIPRSKGGTHTWDNVVTACEKCNSTKGDRITLRCSRSGQADRLLQETPIMLRTQPKAPIHPAIAFAEQFWKEQHSVDT